MIPAPARNNDFIWLEMLQAGMILNRDDDESLWNELWLCHMLGIILTKQARFMMGHYEDVMEMINYNCLVNRYIYHHNDNKNN